MTVWPIEVTDRRTVYVHKSSDTNTIILTDDVYSAKQFSAWVYADEFLTKLKTPIANVLTVEDHIFNDGESK